LVGGTAVLTVLLIFRLLLCTWCSEIARIRLRQRYMHYWGRLVVWLLGMRVMVDQGAAPDEWDYDGLFSVSNHYGPIDIAVLVSLWPASYVSRHDLAAWPGIGFLARLTGTLFANRDLKVSSLALVDQVAKRLKKGGSVHAFAEGMSTDGQRLLPFKSPLFEAAIRARSPVLPVALRYESLSGRPITFDNRDDICWYGNMPFGPHVLGVLGHRRIRATVIFEEVIPPAGNRKTMAREARSLIAEHWSPLVEEETDEESAAEPARMVL
jgi:1-acyl-sn-glycerol-3-phosphate acyltransferase